MPPGFALSGTFVDAVAAASFAGQHQTLLNVPSVGELEEALCEIWWLANS
ncbi:hypothetical protein WH5701_08684 [Synechococcus sp. WH 5701]|nr:hypothetical protein WH5701_08684 [Synechococcus sp. WH 5701]